MIKVRVNVSNETDSFTVVVYAKNVQRAKRIARDLYPGSVVEIAFPIEPDGFFAAGRHYEGRADLEGTIEVREA
jgi:hypothetical protein